MQGLRRRGRILRTGQGRHIFDGAEFLLCLARMTLHHVHAGKGN